MRSLRTYFCSVTVVTCLGVLYLTAVHLGGPDWSAAPLDTLKLTSPDEKLPGQNSATVSSITMEYKGNSEAKVNVLSKKSTSAPLDTLKLTSPDEKLPTISGQERIASISTEYEGMSEATEDLLSTVVKNSTGNQDSTQALPSPDTGKYTKEQQVTGVTQALPSPVVHSEDEVTLSKDHVLHILATAEPHQPISVPRQSSEAVTNQRALEYVTPPNQTSSDPRDNVSKLPSTSELEPLGNQARIVPRPSNKEVNTNREHRTPPTQTSSDLNNIPSASKLEQLRKQSGIENTPSVPHNPKMETEEEHDAHTFGTVSHTEAETQQNQGVRTPSASELHLLNVTKQSGNNVSLVHREAETEQNQIVHNIKFTSASSELHLQNKQARNNNTLKVSRVCTETKNQKPQTFRKPSTPIYGATLALSYWDQITSSLKRVAGLQCWADRNNMVVVEPFVKGTRFVGTPASSHNVTENMRFRDIFDIQRWNSYCRSSSYSLLVSWSDFLQTAPRDVVLAEVIYGSLLSRSQRTNTTSRCTFSSLRRNSHVWLEPHGFKVHREVCIDFGKRWHFTDEQLNYLLFRHDASNRYTVVFGKMQGFGRDNWAFKLESKRNCNLRMLRNVPLKYFHPSPQLLQQADKYIHMYLDSRGYGYTAVMIRWERLLKTKPAGRTCVSWIKRNKWMNNTSRVFLAVDTGSFGSHSEVMLRVNRQTAEYTEQLLRLMNNNKPLTLQQYEQQFRKVISTENPAYVSVLQKTVAAHAKCLLLIGGGAFQHNVSYMWRQFHPNQKCLKYLEKC